MKTIRILFVSFLISTSLLLAQVERIDSYPSPLHQI